MAKFFKTQIKNLKKFNFSKNSSKKQKKKNHKKKNVSMYKDSEDEKNSYLEKRGEKN